MSDELDIEWEDADGHVQVVGLEAPIEDLLHEQLRRQEEADARAFAPHLTCDRYCTPPRTAGESWACNHGTRWQRGNPVPVGGVSFRPWQKVK